MLRDAARFGVMAVGMTFVIVNKDLDLSVGSTLGLIVAVLFSIAFAPSHFDLGIGVAIWSPASSSGSPIGLINGALVTVLRVPAFIATLTMLFIGRGFVLGLTGGKTIAYEQRRAIPGSSPSARPTRFGFNNQILIFLVVAVVGGVVLASTRWGYETYAVGGNEMASRLCRHPHATGADPRLRAVAPVRDARRADDTWPRTRASTSQLRRRAHELIVIAAVIVGGASILGGRGRDPRLLPRRHAGRADRQGAARGHSDRRASSRSATSEMVVQAMAALPPGAVPAFLGLILLVAVLIEPWIFRRKLVPRLLGPAARHRPLPVPEVGEVAIEAVQTHGSAMAAQAIHAPRADAVPDRSARRRR